MTDPLPTLELSSPPKKSPNSDPVEYLINSIKADGGSYRGIPMHDYCQHFVDSGERPQNFIRDYDEEKRFLEYPKLKELIQLKNEVLRKRATPAKWIKCDLKTFNLGQLGKFDVILVDPPLREYYERARMFGVDLTAFQPWSWDEIKNLNVEAIADNSCFVFLWVGNCEGLDVGRNILKHWGFRRCEDIVWVKTNKMNFSGKSNSDNCGKLLQHTKEHCLVGIKGQIKRGVDSHLINANIDTDVILSEEPPQGSTEKPEELYNIIERFCLGRKRIELFGEDRNKRPGWLTLGNMLSNSNFDLEEYNNYFRGNSTYPEVQGYEGGRYVGTTPEIEALRPKTPPKSLGQNSSNQGNTTNCFNNKTSVIK